MELEIQHDHIMKFIDGFESILKQNKFKHYVEVGGVESYSISSLHAEGIKCDLVNGFENFVTDGLKKLADMVLGFLKTVKEYFFGRDAKVASTEKKAEAIKTETKEIVVKLHGIDKNGPHTTTITTTSQSSGEDVKKHYAKIDRINNYGKKLSDLIAKTKNYFTGAENLIQAISSASEEGGKTLGGSPATLNAIKNLKQDIEKFDEYTIAAKRSLEKFQAYEIPTGNRMDLNALDKILALNADLVYTIKTQMNRLQSVLNISTTITKSIDADGGDAETKKNTLRFLQLVNKRISARMNNFIKLTDQIKTVVGDLNEILS